MSSVLQVSRPLPSTPRVLIVDDDRRVRELLEIALSAHGFGVITAADGDEAILRAQAERPDLVLLDMRLPKRSGLEVCDALRNDPGDPTVPIVMISAASEAEQRLHAFTRGADDYMAKPFSPKELVARLRRLLARATESRVAIKRLQELEREVASAKREAKRAGHDAQHEHDLREIADGPARDLLQTLDQDRLAALVLSTVRTRFGAGTAALLLPDRDGMFRPWAIAGDRWGRLRRLALDPHGDAACWLGGLRRPMTLEDLARRCDRRDETGALAAGRWWLVAPLPEKHRLAGIIVADERADMAPYTHQNLEALGVVCDLAGVAFANARSIRVQSDGWLRSVADQVYRSDRLAAALAETRELARRAVAALELPPGEREAVDHALAFVDTGVTDATPAHDVLAAVAPADPSGLASRSLALLEESTARGASGDPAVALAAALREFMRSRARGVAAEKALARAVALVAERPVVAAALETPPSH